MHVLLDVHAANNCQQSAVARSIAQSHEDLHEVTSISSCADPNSQSAFPSTLSQREWISAWNSDQQPRFILFNKLFQQFLIDGLQTVPSTNFLIWIDPTHNLRIFFGMHHEALHEFFIHYAVLTQFFIHHDVLVTFPSFPTFLIRHELLITFPNFPLKSVETCRVLNQFSQSTSLEISGIFSSIPIQHFSDVTTLSSIHLVGWIQRRNLYVVINMT